MRTLKKVLALTVVLATLLSISAFAAFSDEESINENFVDAVNLLGALNVMTGDTEGTFRPNETISRAEAAKMIYVIRNGGVDDRAEGWTGMSTFSDVTPGVWYEGYVNYCASIGIIDGIGGGLFNPSGAVTGVELAKMMLVVADYRSDIEGYTGAGWNLNVIRDAQSAGMFKGYTLAYSAAATREQAAQLFSNAILETEMAVYIGDVRVNSAAVIGNAETVGGRFFDLAIQTGVLTKVPHVALPISVISGQNNAPDDVIAENTESVLNVNDEMSTIAAFNDSEHLAYVDSNGNNRTHPPIDFEFAADPDLLFQEVNVIYQENNEGGILDRKSKVYAVLPTGDSDVYETTMDAITIELRDDSKTVNYTQGSADYNPITIQFEGYNGGRAKVLTQDFDLPVVTNLYEGKTLDIYTAGSDGGSATGIMSTVDTAEWNRKVYVVDPSSVEFLATTSTAPVRLIDIDHDGNLDVAFVTTPYYGTVKTYDPNRFDFSTDAEVVANENITSERDEDIFVNFTFEDELEKDDVIAVTLDVLSGEMQYNVALVEPTVGNLTHVYSTLPDNAVTIGGETYGFYGLKFDGEYLKDETPAVDATAYTDELGAEVTVYTDGKYIISAYVEPATIGDDFAFVSDYNTVGNSSDKLNSDSRALILELVLPSGETVQLEYDRDADAADGVYTEDELVKDPEDETKRTATALLARMVGNIVEVNIDGDFVTIKETGDSDLENDPDLRANYHDTAADDADAYSFNSETDIFSFKNNSGSGSAPDIASFAVDETSVFFIGELKDVNVTGAGADTQRADVYSDVSVIMGDELRGTPDIIVDNTIAGVAGDHVMQLVTALRSGIRTAAYGVLDPDSNISEGGLYAYSLTQDWEQKLGEDAGDQLIRAVLSDVSAIDDMAELELGTSNHLANKVYRAFLNADGSYDFEQVRPGIKSARTNSTMDLGSIDSDGQNNRVTIDGSLYVVTDDTQIFVVNTRQSNGTRIELGDYTDLTEADTDAANNAYDNILYEVVNGNELSVVYVEAAGGDLESLVTYKAETSVDFTDAGLNLSLPAKSAKIQVQSESDKYKATVKVTDASGMDYSNQLPASPSGEYTVEITLKANPGIVFSSQIGKDSIKVPDDYTMSDVTVGNDGETLTIKLTFDGSNVKDGAVNETTVETDSSVSELATAMQTPQSNGPHTVTPLTSGMIASAEVTWEDSAITSVELTFSADFDTTALQGDNADAILQAIANQLGLNLNDVELSIAALMVSQFMAPAADETIGTITAAEFDPDTGILTLTVNGNDMREEITLGEGSVSLSTITAVPAAGEALPTVTEVTVAEVEGIVDNKATVEQWTGANEGNAVADATHTLTLTFTAEAGYKFAADLANNIVALGEGAEGWTVEVSVSPDLTELVITIKNTDPIAAAAEGPTEIDTVTLSVSGNVMATTDELSELIFTISSENGDQLELTAPVEWKDSTSPDAQVVTDFSSENYPLTGTATVTVKEASQESFTFAAGGVTVTKAITSSVTTGETGLNLTFTAEGSLSEDTLTVTITIGKSE